MLQSEKSRKAYIYSTGHLLVTFCSTDIARLVVFLNRDFYTFARLF